MSKYLRNSINKMVIFHLNKDMGNGKTSNCRRVAQIYRQGQF